MHSLGSYSIEHGIAKTTIIVVIFDDQDGIAGLPGRPEDAFGIKRFHRVSIHDTNVDTGSFESLVGSQGFVQGNPSTNDGQTITVATAQDLAPANGKLF